MLSRNATLLLTLTVSIQGNGNISSNSSEIAADISPWYFSGEGAMAFSVVTILVYGMSIVFFILMSMRKNPVDRDEEKQIWLYIKQYGNIRSSALKDDEQRIRAKLLSMSMLGNVTPRASVQIDDRRMGKITKLKDRRVNIRMIKPIPKCLYVDTSGDTSPKLRNSNSLNSLHNHLITTDSIHKRDRGSCSFDELGSDYGGNETQPILDQLLNPQHECFQSVNEKLDSVESKTHLGFPKSTSCPDSSYLSSPNRLQQLHNLHRLNPHQGDIEELSGDISLNDMHMIMSRRRKRSGFIPPRKELLETSMDSVSSSDTIDVSGVTHDRYRTRRLTHISQGESRETSVEDLVDTQSIVLTSPSKHPGPIHIHPLTDVSCSRLDIIDVDDKLSLKTRDENISKHNTASSTTRLHRQVSFDTPRPRLAKNRRTQSFRFQDKKRQVKRKGSLEPMVDVQFVKSLACRRRDRQSRISTVCLPHGSDSGSSNDIILPAVTLRPVIQNNSSDDNTHKPKDVTEAYFGESQIHSETELDSDEPKKDMVVLLPSVASGQEAISSSNISKDHKLKWKQQRRAGVTNVQFKRGGLMD